MKNHAVPGIFTAATLLLGVSSGFAQGSQPCVANAPVAPAPTEESAVVEAAVTGEQDGYRYRAYIADWRGYRILLRDPLQRTDFPAGSNVNLLIMRHEIAGRRILDFDVLDSGSDRGRSSAKQAPMKPAPMNASSVEQSGLVEDVLSAQQDGFRFRAYVVDLQGQRVPVFDTLSLSDHAIGEQIDVLGVRLNTGHGALAVFQVRPDAHAVARLRPPGSTVSVSRESGTIDEVLAAQSGGYRYRAYVVQWHGTRVVVPDQSSQTDYEAGDTLTFLARRVSDAGLPGSLLTFSLPAAALPAADVTDPALQLPSARNSAQMVQETAAVADVLHVQDGANRYQAYLVDWRGARVAVLDMLTSSPLAIGQQISFSVERFDAAGADPTADRRQLAFMRFDFPRPASPCARTGG